VAITGLDRRIADVYGVEVDTGPLVPARGARPEALVLAAEQVALAIGEARPRRQPRVEPTWTAVPLLPAPAIDRDAALARLLTWAADVGARFDAIEIVVAPDGNRSVRARRAIGEDEPIITVPRALMVIDEEIATTPVGRAVESVLSQLHSGHTLVSTWLATERRLADSSWRPYLDALPARLPDLPFFHGDADLDELAGTAARIAAGEAHASVVEDHDELLKLPALAGLPLADFGWARAILGSRAFKVTIEGRDLRALVPVADLFDHGSTDATWAFDDDAQTFVVSALRPIDAGEEIQFSYGQYPNSRYLVGYGFATPDNPEDDGLVRFARADDARTDLAGHLVWDLPLGAEAALPAGTSLTRETRRAISVARLRAATPRELVAAADRGRFHKRELRWLGSRIELEALGLLAAAARTGLKRLGPGHPPTGSPTSWQRTCAVIRASERATLEQLIAFTSAAAAHVSSPSAHAWRAAADDLPDEPTGADRLLRDYLRATADELPK
jgi:hypothetical protein